MPVYSIDAGSNWGYINSSASSYTNARAGSGTKTLYTALDGFAVGQGRISSSNFNCYQAYIEFDTAFLAGKTIVSAVLKLYIDGLVTTSAAFTIEARLHDFGSSVTTADFVAGASLSGKTLLASIASGSISVNDQNDLTDVAMVANINTSGKTRIVLSSDRMRTGTSPTVNNTYEYANVESPLGLVQVPVLEVTTTEPSGEVVKTLANATLSGAATLDISGSFTATLANATLTTAATLTSAASGNVVATLANATISIDVDSTTYGYLEATLANATLNTVALVDLNGSVTATLGNATLDAFGGKPIEGTLTVTLGNATLVTSTLSGITGTLSATLADAVLAAAETSPLWPTVYDFPQCPLEGTWRPILGDDTLRSEREIGARQVRSRNGGNYSEVGFAIAIVNRAQRIELDRFFEDDCQAGTRPFLWEDPETGVLSRFTWIAPPALRDWDGLHFVAECELRKENT